MLPPRPGSEPAREALAELANALQALVLSLEAWQRHGRTCEHCKELEAMGRRVLSAAQQVKSSLCFWRSRG